VVTLGFLCVPVILGVPCGIVASRVHARWPVRFCADPLRSVLTSVTVSFGFFVGLRRSHLTGRGDRIRSKDVPIILLATVTILWPYRGGRLPLGSAVVREHASDLDHGCRRLQSSPIKAQWPILGTVGDALYHTRQYRAATIAFLTTAAALSATAAVDGLLPLWLAAIHPHFRSPHRAVLVQGFLGVLLPFAVSAGFHTSPST